jgi:6-pyruvoyltetrahydropterin/6-carboxytetrahydropterin synthase
MDFSLIKEIVNNSIVKNFDHALLLHNVLPEQVISTIEAHFPKVKKLHFSPTCEKLVAHFFSVIKEYLPQQIELVKLRLWETESSFAEYRAEDN